MVRHPLVRLLLAAALLAALLLWALSAAAGRLGLTVRDAPPPGGAEVTAVVAGSAAEAAGLRPGDLIREVDGVPVMAGGDLAQALESRPDAPPHRLTVERAGWRSHLTLGAPAEATAAPAASPGGRATVAVGDFQVKAAKATPQIGDGLREMFLTALHESGYFVVVERMDIRGLAAEQALSRSDMADPAAAVPAGQMDVADLLVYGVVSEFEPEAGGVAFSNFLPQLGMSVRQSSKFSEMAIDVRAVDVRTGRVLVAQRIPGTAQAYGGGIGGRIGGGALSMPVGLGMYRGTPMEFAIRDCIRKATYFVINQVPRDYFRHP